jgi:short-subunit dehydrogenase
MAAQHTPRRKTALVTGASSGIGEAFAELLAAEQFDLLITARREARLRAVADRLSERHGTHVEIIACDLTAADAPAELCAEIDRRGLTIDALVNCAGFGVAGSYTSAPWISHHEMLQLLVAAPCELTYRLLPPMLARGYGRIVNVASTAGVAALPAGTMYGAAKTMLVRFSESLAREVAPHGVQVTAICPGLTSTAFHAAPGMRETVTAMPRWLLMEPSEVAREGWAAVSSGRAVAVSGRINRLQVTLFRWLPMLLILAGGKTLLRAARSLRSGRDSSAAPATRE